MTDFWTDSTPNTSPAAATCQSADCFARFARTYGWPEHYLALDLVTTGLNPARDLIVEIGICAVHDRQVMERHNWVLDWTREPSIDQHWLQSRLADTAARLADRGRIYPYDWQQLHQVGIPPREALLQALARCHATRVAHACLVGHSLWDFDLPWLRRHSQEWLDQPDILADARVIDVGLLEKARQLDLRPDAGEPLANFWNRVLTDKSEAPWSLRPYCLLEWDLEEVLYALRGQPEHADVNAYLAHRLLEAYRQHTEP